MIKQTFKEPVSKIVIFGCLIVCMSINIQATVQTVTPAITETPSTTPYLTAIGVVSAMTIYNFWPESAATHYKPASEFAPPQYNQKTWSVEKFSTYEHPTMGEQPDMIHMYRIVLGDGYHIELNIKDATWTLIYKDLSSSSSDSFFRVFGDPHIQTNKSTGKRKHSLGYICEFNKNTTFVTENGIQIHAFLKNKQGKFNEPHTDELVIVHGNQSMGVSGISVDQPVISPPVLNKLHPLNGRKTDLKLYMINNSASDLACGFGDNNCAQLLKTTIKINKNKHLEKPGLLLKD